MRKKYLIISSCIILSTLSINAQTFQKGDLIGNFTIGIGNAIYSGLYYTSSVPPLALSAEYCVADQIIDKGSIGLGGMIGYTGAKYSYGYYDVAYSATFSSFAIGPGIAFHYPFVDKLDTYAGFIVGYDIVSASYGNSVVGNVVGGAASAGFFVGFIGARYYFTDKFAVLAQLGSGFAYFNLGVTVKLK